MSQTCTHCQSAFSVEPGDQAFFAKMKEVGGTEIPPPTLCPRCRQQRRMSFRNERTLYERSCDVTGAKIISIFAPESPHKVCEKNHWYSGKFDPMVYGRSFDFNRPFFEQFHELLLEIPLPSLRVERSENCEFNNDMSDCEDCYLCARTHQSKKLLYTYRGNKSTDSIDCNQITESEFLYECTECVHCQSSQYLSHCSGCGNCAFLLDCRDCMDCFMCCNLRKKRYCFLNEQLTEQEYKAKLAEFDFGSHNLVQKAYKMFEDIKKRAIRRNLMIIKAEDCTGDIIFESKDCQHCFSVQFSQDGRYLWDTKRYKDAMDCYSGGRNSELIYETTSVTGSYNVMCCMRAFNTQNTAYSFYTTSSKNIFGCVGMRNTEYCILNKQYSKEEYEELLSKIIEHMKKTGEFGEFFPASCSPFAYNETAAQEFIPLTKKEANTLGYRWKEDDPKEYQKQTTTLPDNINDAEKSIVDETLACEICAKNYRITPQELTFYKQQTICLPRQCHNCRHMQRLEMKNPWQLRGGTCRNCSKQIETSFPEDTVMQVYCESCYENAIA